MIILYRRPCIDRSLIGDIYQDPQSFGEKIQDYLEGNHVLDSTTEGSFDFDSAEDVDFEKELPKSNPDIFDVASGQDKVFPEVVVTDEFQDPISEPLEPSE